MHTPPPAPKPLQGPSCPAEMPRMDRPRVLILDDGELGRLYVALRRRGLDPMRVSGDDIEDGLPMPSDLLITSGRRTLSAPALAVSGAGGAPTWICVHTQDFHPLRERLRGLGVHYLVQSGASETTLDLFFGQLLHKGGERRSEKRMPIGCEVHWSWTNRTQHKAVLLDLASRSLRIEAAEELPVGALVEIELPAELAGDAVGIHALVDRCKATPDKSHGRWEIALLWDSLEPSERELIDSLASGRRIGTGITPLQTLPYVDGTGIPDWDEMARAADRRSDPRHRYSERVDAFPANPGTDPIRALGCDLSARGMRIGPAAQLEVGADLTLALYGGNQTEPILIEARVERRHPDASLGLVFTLLDSTTRLAIDRVLEALPCVASMSGSERILPTEIRFR